MMNWTMNKIGVLILFLIAVIVSSQSCGERTLIRHYYVLEATEDSLAFLEDSFQIKGNCEILRVQIPPAYDQQRTKIFTFASSSNLNMLPDYQILSQVYKLEVEDINDQFQVSLEMRMEFIEYSSGNTVLIHRFERKKPLEERDLNLFASKLSQIFQEETSQFILKIASYLNSMNPEQSAEN